MASAWQAAVSELVTALGSLSQDVDRVEQLAYDPHLIASLRQAEDQATLAVSRAKFDVSSDSVHAEAIARARATIARAQDLAAGLLAELERSRRIERRAVELCDEALSLTLRNKAIRTKPQPQ